MKSEAVDPLPPSYLPRVADPLAAALSRRAAWAAATFSGLPYQAFKTDFWRALPYEKVRAHGLATPVKAFMALRFKEASSSDCPPERKQTPGRAGTIVLERVLTVNQSISPFVALVLQLAPGVIMFGLRRSPSMRRC